MGKQPRKQPRKQSRNQSSKKSIARDQQPNAPQQSAPQPSVPQPSAPQPSPEQGSAEIVQKVKIVTASATPKKAEMVAISEFKNFATQLKLAEQIPEINASIRCDKKPEWCVPDIACAARVTLTRTDEDVKALEEYRKKYRTKIVN